MAALLPKGRTTQLEFLQASGGKGAQAFQPYAHAGHANVIPPKSLSNFLSF